MAGRQRKLIIGARMNTAFEAPDTMVSPEQLRPHRQVCNGERPDDVRTSLHRRGITCVGRPPIAGSERLIK
jgi:hypothetical protein